MILNWGGVGNVTYLGSQGEIIAFDTGPANALIDDFLILRRGLAFDENGALGATGRIDSAALAALMSDTYFDSPAPKARPQSLQRRRRLRRTPKRRGWRGDARRIHGRIDRGRAEACAPGAGALAGRGRRTAKPEPHAPA
jgi:1,6-anhydro-N-acetylmuramate kinase